MKDIDVLLSFDDAMRVAQKLGLKASSADGTDLFRSRFFTQWREPAIPVEFMAELEVKTAHGWRTISPETRQTRTLAGVEFLFLLHRSFLILVRCLVGQKTWCVPKNWHAFASSKFCSNLPTDDQFFQPVKMIGIAVFWRLSQFQAGQALEQRWMPVSPYCCLIVRHNAAVASCEAENVLNSRGRALRWVFTRC